MRAKRTVQSSIFDQFGDHEVAQELSVLSHWLDAHPDMLDWVAADLQERAVQATGRQGMPVESVLRCAILKQQRQYSYSDLAFSLLDSSSCQAFARLPMGCVASKSVLHRTISAISAATWERINRRLLASAQATHLENGKMLRIDSTVTDSPILTPSDSTLLWDCVRTMVRLLQQATQLPGTPELVYRDHTRVAKKRMLAIRSARGKDRKARLYADLVKVTRNTLGYLEQAHHALRTAGVGDVWRQEMAMFKPLICKVIDQTERRVFRGEKVPAAEKVVSLFEPHTDIIKKGGREVQYGHKLNLSTGRSGLVLDVVIEPGNPADSERFLPMLDRHIEHYGQPPRQVAADGGYASQANVQAAKARQVKDVAFHKRCGLDIKAMVKSPWVYRKLKKFRAGIEAGISYLKRVFGLRRCTWKGLEHFKAYVWSSVVSHNLTVLSRWLTT